MAPPRFLELVRVSSQAQAAKESPEDQRRALDTLRRSRPGTLVERLDSTVSGASDDRADLARLFELAAAKAFDEVRVRHVDRLTRHPDLRQRAAVLGALIDAGAVIVETSGRVIDPADEMGELDATLQGWIASRERKRILERTLAARKRLAAEGKIQGRPPWGRRWDKRAGAWSETPQMAIYRRLFREVLAGKSLQEIADALNAEGVATPRGRRWTTAHLSRLIQHPACAGKLEGWGQTFAIPPVVDAATWRAAKARLRANGQRSGPPGHHPALLRRVASCGECGARMWVQRGGRTGDVRTYYVCSRHRAPTHEVRWHAASKVDEKVKAVLLERLRDPTSIDGAAAEGERPADHAAEVKVAEKTLRRLQRQERDLIGLWRAGTLSKAGLDTELADLTRDRQHAESALAMAKARLEAGKRSGEIAADLAARIERIRKNLDRAPHREWVGFVREMFAPPGSVRIYNTGRIVLDGLLQFARSDSSDRGDCIPLRVVA